MRRAALLGCVLLSVACRAGEARRPPVVELEVASEDGAAEAVMSHAPPRRAGVAHAAAIEAVAISSDGQAALSRDTLGSVRLWPTLDGTEEPMVVPVSGAASMSVETHADGWTVAIVEPAGSGRVLRLDKDGGASLLAELVPFEPLFELHVRPGGEDVLALYRDHRIVWMDARGRELAAHAERRFRPSSLQLAADGDVLGAIVLDGMKDGVARGELQRFSLRGGDDRAIEPLGSPRVFTSRQPPGPANVRLSPDGDKLAFAGKEPSAWKLHVVEMEGGDPRVFDLTLPQHVGVGIGWLANDQILAGGQDGNLAWLVDLDRGESFPRSAVPQIFGQPATARAHAAGRMVSGHSSWLHVQDEGGGQRYLGYDVLDTRSAAISGSGRYVAWGYGQGEIFVEDLEGRHEPVAVDAAARGVMARLLFLDDDHVATIDHMGGIRVVAWRTGRVTARTSAGGSIRDLEYDQERGLLTLVRHNGDPRLFEISPDEGLAGPYIVPATATAAGVWRDQTGEDPGAALWVIEGQKLLSFSLEELRRGISREEIERRRETAISFTEAPRAFSRHGARFVVRWGNEGQELDVVQGDDTRTMKLGQAAITRLLPSPRGGAFLLTRQNGQQHSIELYTAEGDAPAWTFSTGTHVTDVSWSHDGARVALASPTGGVVLDVRDGAIAAARCGFGFQARGSGINQNGMQGVRPICEQY